MSSNPSANHLNQPVNMAKGARASSIKTNNAALKKKVFGPVETSRTERLSAKLLELIAQPKPERPKKDVSMEVDESKSHKHPPSASQN